MKYPILYPKDATDFFAMGLGPATTALNAVVSEERNGIFILEMTVVVDDDIFPKLNEDCILKADAGHLLKDQRFRIKRIVPTEGNTATVYAEHVSYLAGELSLKPEVDLPTQNATSALNVWKGNIIDSNPFIVDSDIATTGSTHWRIDKVKNARQALGGVEGSILDVFGGEYRFDNYHISLLKKRGTTAKTMIAYGRNITTFEQERNISDTYTSVFPYALYSDDDQNQHLVTLPGYFVDAENIANYPNRKALPVDFSNQFDQDEVPTAEKLQNLAESYIKSNQIGVPKVSITVSFLDLSKTADYAEFAPLEEVNLCDDVRVVYPKLGVDVISKVVGVKWNVLSESYDEITIGSKAANISTIINDVQDSTEKAEDNANNAQVSADGKNTIFYGLYGEDGLGEPVANKVGDMWFKPEGEFIVLYIWNGTIWERVISDGDIDAVQKEVDEHTKEIDDVRETANSGVAKAEDAIKQAGFNKNLIDEMGDLITIAQGDATQALDDASNAMDEALKALENNENLKDSVNVSLTEIEGGLALKADQITVDEINKTVTNQGTLISANTEAIKLKASQTDVNTLNGKVTDVEGSIGVIAGQVSLKASQDEVDTLTGKVNSNSASIDVNADNISSLVTKTDGTNTLVNQIKQTADSNTQAISDSNGKISSLEQNLNGLQITVSDKADKTQVTQLADLWQQTTELVDGHTSQISSLGDAVNLRVEKGDVLSQINIEADKTLIQSGTIYLDAETVTFSGKAFIPSAAITNLNADKITTGTLNAANVDIINLDVNSLTGNKATFVQAGFNGINSNVQIDSGGLVATHNDGSQTIINSSGLFHKEGGTTYETHYLTYQAYIDINHDMSGPLRVQLPAIFKGKNFKARLTLSDTVGVTTDPNYYNLALLRICCSVVENQIDYANAIVPCIGYSFHKLLPNGSNYYFKIRATLTVTL